MRTIRASEIGSYLFCHRAWWYQLQGAPSINQKELAAGSQYHHRHGRTVLRADFLRAAGWVLLMLAILAFAILLTLQFLHA